MRASYTSEYVASHASHHTTHVCYWRCPVPSCPLWFTSELNGKDRIENIHHFREGRGYSFDECLRKFGLEWFGSRQFFAEKSTTGQALWTDMALARHSGQELHNSYTITGSPDFSPLRRFFIAAVAALQSRYDTMTPLDYVTPANRSLRFLETGAPESPCVPMLSSRAVVPGTCLASTDLLSFIDQLLMDRLALHDHRAARDWPAEDRSQLLAVAHRDLHVARRNVADLTKYLDDHAAQLAMYVDAGDDTVPLMTVETFPRLTGGVRAVLEDTLH